MTPFETESWLWYGVVMVVVFLRFLSRILHFKSLRRFQIEDYLMIFITCSYTINIVLINIGATTNTNLIDPNDIPALTPDDIAERTYGSKVIIGVEQTMCIVQWGCKVCLLFLYYRLTENLVQNMFVKAVGVYVATTYVIMEILYLGYWCRPFSDYWQTPTDNVQCTTALHHLIVNLSFNLSSDLLIMSIPLPLLLRARLEIKRKILLCFPFTLGFFSIICAIISKHVSFTEPFSPVWVYWYTREASCVMIVSNMPYTWGLMRRVFKLKSFWSRGDSISEIDSLEAAETHDSGMQIMGGEVREINGVPISTGSSATVKNEKSAGSSTWTRMSSMFAGDKNVQKSASEITFTIHDHSEKTSPTSTRSNESEIEEPWKTIEWAKETASVEVARITTPQSSLSPDAPMPSLPTLTPPSPAVIGPGSRPLYTAESRRASPLELRRASTHGSKKTRTSLPEASRRSQRGSVNVDAVDRLYRLDDEDLLADLEAARPRSRDSRVGAFG